MAKLACWVGCSLSRFGTLSIVTFQKTRAEAMRNLTKRKPNCRYFLMNLMDGDSEEQGTRLQNFLIGNKVPLEHATRMVREFANECAGCFKT